MKSMTKRARTILFILFVFLFILMAPAVVFYSQGYRVDFDNRKIVRTGGFYFKVVPSRAEVYLNNELKKNTSIITNSVFIENLLPKTYEVEIKRSGYHPWKKTLEVKEKEVTDAKNITLFPQNPQFTILNQAPPKITASATSADKNKIVESDNYEIWVMLSEKKEKIFLTRFSEKISDIFWLNNDYLIFVVGNKIKIAEIDNRDGLNIVDLAELEKPKIFWDKDAKKLYVISEEKTYLLESLLP